LQKECIQHSSGDGLKKDNPLVPPFRYPSLVRPDLPSIVAPYLLQLLTSADVGAGRHSATAAEILAEGMVATWQPLLGSLNQLVSQVLGMTERLSGVKGKAETLKPSGESGISPAVAMVVRESLATTLLPALCVADVPEFLQVLRVRVSRGLWAL
jgi:hypothetical protein